MEWQTVLTLCCVGAALASDVGHPLYKTIDPYPPGPRPPIHPPKPHPSIHPPPIHPRKPNPLIHPRKQNLPIHARKPNPPPHPYQPFHPLINQLNLPSNLHVRSQFPHSNIQVKLPHPSIPTYKTLKSYPPKFPHPNVHKPKQCKVDIPSPISDLKLLGAPIDVIPLPPKSGAPLCRSRTLVLASLTVDIEIGPLYARRTRKEVCLVDKALNIQYVTCRTSNCNTCQSSLTRRCVPVTTEQRFRAICRPLTASVHGNGSKGKIRDLKVKLPTCCQCQTFECFH